MHYLSFGVRCLWLKVKTPFVGVCCQLNFNEGASLSVIFLQTFFKRSLPLRFVWIVNLSR